MGIKPTGDIRLLKAHEVSVRVQQITKTAKASCILYIDARVMMDVMDEAYGPMNWQRKHKLIGDTLYGVIEVWDGDKKTWVAKEDVGTESNTEAIKGRSSDAAKRAAVNWGVARELYTSPRILVPLQQNEYVNDNGRLKAPYFSLSVSEIECNDNREISYLVLKDPKGSIRFTSGKKGTKKPALIEAGGTVGDGGTVDDGYDDNSTAIPKGAQAKPNPEAQPKQPFKPAEKVGTPTVTFPVPPDVSTKDVKKSGIKETMQKVHDKVVSLTKDMATKDKVPWAKEHIEPFAGTMNYKQVKDIDKLNTLYNHVKDMK